MNPPSPTIRQTLLSSSLDGKTKQFPNFFRAKGSAARRRGRFIRKRGQGRPLSFEYVTNNLASQIVRSEKNSKMPTKTWFAY